MSNTTVGVLASVMKYVEVLGGGIRSGGVCEVEGKRE